jgi:hypothetical protein
MTFADTTLTLIALFQKHLRTDQLHESTETYDP